MTTTAVQMDDVRLRRGSRVILAGVTLEVARGEVVAVMGQSGSGKTTMLRMIAGLEPFDQGVLTVDGLTVPCGAPSGTVLRVLRQKVGMVFQFHHLFEHLPALHNVWLAPVHVQRVPSKQAMGRARELLRVLGVEHRADALPRELSGGEAQRVAIARALAVDPPILLMDEPTASLDPSRRAELATLVSSLASQNRTIILTTHDDQFAEAAATRVVRVSDGKVVAGAI